MAAAANNILTSLAAELGAATALKAELANLQATNVGLVKQVITLLDRLANCKFTIAQDDVAILERERRIEELTGDYIKFNTRLAELLKDKELLRAQVVRLFEENLRLRQSLEAADKRLCYEHIHVDEAIGDFQARSAELAETREEVAAALEFSAAAGVQQST